MGLFLTIWERPGSATPGQKIADAPTQVFSIHDGVGVTGNGNMTIPDSYPHFDDILNPDMVTPANTVSSMVRVFDDSYDPPRWVFDWLPKSMLPVTSKSDFDVSVNGLGIKSIFDYGIVEAFDWDGSADWVPTFPDWIYGGRNLIFNEGFEEASFQPRIYLLVIDATAGTFTLSDGTDTTSGIPFDVGTRTLEGIIEADLGEIDDLSVTPEPGNPLQYELRVTADGGTFTLSGPSDTTGNLAFNIAAGSLESAIEGLTGITNVNVTAATLDGEPGYIIDLITPATVDLSIDTSNLTGGSATLNASRTADGFQLELVTPPVGVSLTVDDSGLTGDASLMLLEEGNDNPSGWTESQGVSTGVPRLFGVYDAFERSDAQAHSGTYSLLIDPGAINSRIDAFAGAQQVLRVQPNGLYQAGIWVYPTAAGQTYRLVVRGVDEDIMLRADGSEARTDVTPPPNVWTFVGISDVVPEDSTVIFRFANTNLSGNPATFFIDDAFFDEGMPADTWGKILLDQYADMTVDHVADGRLVWEDEANPGTSYLIPDFTDTVDSNGQPWAESEIQIKLYMRMSMTQVMQQKPDYEMRLVPLSLEDGTYTWQVFNPDTMGTDYTLAPSPAIQGGAEDTRRSLQRFLPSGSVFMVEGLGRVTYRTVNSDLDSALGRIETARIDREAPTQQAVQTAALSDSAEALIQGVQYQYTLTDPIEIPGSAYVLGDWLNIHDPPLVDTTARFADYEITVTPTRSDYTVTFIPVET